jgi:hypothetical protein
MDFHNIGFLIFWLYLDILDMIDIVISINQLLTQRCGHFIPETRAILPYLQATVITGTDV